ncbi:divergent polysaccharide deacetylase family protein [Shewanella sp. 10N.7]|uniref:divergent polysaccharide deacetylase family protein n=1 Tax=Shewanella sp. 10N.7 TaxID=2885093 RepID=UPI001E5ABFD4|nr:divergent polysaccharide deacetylase family protein [Shewanella sp. 10N.7]MCC4833227.1 divergent polysaccharide deacetylase family protein [Shewanella sp. 10N.7]
MRKIFFGLALLITGHVQAANIAIIIDDIGYRQSDEAVLTLPNTVTLSVLPHTPLGQTLAQQGHHQGNEIMLHIPMQALNGKKLGNGGLTNDMDEQQLKRQLKASLENIPYAKGANNHMGSLLTQLDNPMNWLMESLKKKDLYFVDSVTTRYSKASDKALQYGVPLLRREIFLDNDVSEQALEKQFTQIIKKAKTEGSIVVIAHPYPETVRFLNKNLHRLEGKGIDLVHTSKLLPVSMAKNEGTSSAQVLR